MSIPALIIVAGAGFVLGALGGLGSELLDRFAGRRLEAYCRIRRRRSRFGAILDGQAAALRGAHYLRIVGNVLFLVFGTAALVARQGGGPRPGSLLVAAAVAGLLVMLTHLWLPAAVTRFASAPLLFHSWPFWRILAAATSPLAAPQVVLDLITRRLVGHEMEADEEEEQLEDEIRTIVTAGTREGLLGPGVREMIQGVIDLRDDTVGHIMTPRSEVDALEAETPWPEVMRAVAEFGRTRLPVYRDTLDSVIGVLYVKDLMPHLSQGGFPQVPLTDLLRHAWHVPVDRSVDQLLREFLHCRSHMAIVLDEFHQTAGVVTIEDALEEIVGEIVDESDEEEQADVRIIDEFTAEAAGRVMLDELNEQLGWELPESEDYETIAGFVLHHTGGIPLDGERFEIGGVDVEIVRASNRQIELLRLHRRHPPSREAG